MAQDFVIRLVGPEDEPLILAQREGLFDYAADPEQTRAFLASELCEMVIAVEGEDILSFASGTILLHPDKDPSMFINEVGTRDDYQRQGLATKVTQALIARARALDCDGIWLGTEPDNAPALGLYRKLGAEERTIVGFGWDGAFDLE